MKDNLDIFFITDPLVTTAGSVRPGLLLTKKFTEYGYPSTIITTKTNNELQNIVKENKCNLITIGPQKSFINSMPNLDAWFRHILINNKCPKPPDDCYIVNTSSVIILDANAYYAQGIMMNAVKDMMPELSTYFKLGYHLSKPFLNYLEKKTIKKYEKASNNFIANSGFCANMYEDWGITVDDIINPPLDKNLFKPSNNNTQENYILTYYGKLGKESNYKIIKEIANQDIKIKVFGEKPPETILIDHKNIEYLNKVSDQQLVNLYTNALLTLFAFKHEPFGYIPIESMACGTPVLTYKKQGPSETVINEQTGWLVETDEKMVEKIKELWNNGVEKTIRKQCIKSTEKYNIDNIAKKWLKYIQSPPET